MRGYFIIFCWLQMVMVIASATTEAELSTESSSASTSETTTARRRTTTKTRSNQPRRIRGSGNVVPEQDRSLFVKEIVKRDFDEVVSGRKDPPAINKDKYKLVNDLSWRERMFPPTKPPTIAPTTSPSTSPTMEEDNPGYYRQLDRPIRIACAGDSLTRGTSGGNPVSHSYPNQLREMLGGEFEVSNFGRNAATASRGMSVSYVDQDQFQASLDAQPDIYLLMLGTNDSRTWATHGRRFREDYKQLTNSVRNSLAPNPPRIIVALPPWVKEDNFGVENDVIVNNIHPLIRNVAAVKSLELVNMYDITVGQRDIFTGDGVHLNERGYRALASNWRLAIQCNNNGKCDIGENCNSCPGDCFVNCS